MILLRFDFANHEITNVDIDSGAIDAVTLGTNSAITEAQIDDININGSTIKDFTLVSGSVVSTGSFGRVEASTGSFDNVNVQEMSIPSVSEFSSSIATKLDTLEADIIALSIALG